MTTSSRVPRGGPRRVQHGRRYAAGRCPYRSADARCRGTGSGAHQDQGERLQRQRRRGQGPRRLPAHAGSDWTPLSVRLQRRRGHGKGRAAGGALQRGQAVPARPSWGRCAGASHGLLSRKARPVLPSLLRSRSAAGSDDPVEECAAETRGGCRSSIARRQSADGSPALPPTITPNVITHALSGGPRYTRTTR